MGIHGTLKDLEVGDVFVLLVAVELDSVHGDITEDGVEDLARDPALADLFDSIDSGMLEQTAEPIDEFGTGFWQWWWLDHSVNVVDWEMLRDGLLMYLVMIAEN